MDWLAFFWFGPLNGGIVVELQYEPSAAARPVAVENDGGVTRITLSMQSRYAPVPRWLAGLDMFALVVIPVWWAATLAIRTCLRLPKPPRAIFEVSEDWDKDDQHTT